MATATTTTSPTAVDLVQEAVNLAEAVEHLEEARLKTITCATELHQAIERRENRYISVDLSVQANVDLARRLSSIIDDLDEGSSLELNRVDVVLSDAREFADVARFHVERAGRLEPEGA